MVKHPEDDTLDLCCGRRRCPKFDRKPGGFEITDKDAAPGVVIEMSDEQALKWARWTLAKLQGAPAQCIPELHSDV